ncbi:PD40 domain-containing protein, partial [candidate division TA06 bacterium]|nr:PD40 domain-containing protein [candidate division TA06 bacterium]
VYFLVDSSKQCYAPLGQSPQFHPFDSNLLVLSFDEYLQTFNLTNGERNVLDAITSENCKNGFPYWSPDGKKVVFSSAPLEIVGLVPPDGASNLWILEEVTQ